MLELEALHPVGTGLRPAPPALRFAAVQHARQMISASPASRVRAYCAQGLKPCHCKIRARNL